MQVVALVLDVLEQLLTPLPVLLLLTVGQKIIRHKMKINDSSSGIAQDLDSALGLNKYISDINLGGTSILQPKWLAYVRSLSNVKEVYYLLALLRDVG